MSDDKSTENQKNGNNSGHEPVGSEDADQKAISGNRRSAIRKIVLTGGVLTTAQSLSSKWGKPLINSVALPAHAETTEDPHFD